MELGAPGHGQAPGSHERHRDRLAPLGVDGVSVEGHGDRIAQRPRFGLEVVRELSAAGGLLTSDGTVYPLLNRLRDAGLVTSQWQDAEGERARRYYFITDAGRDQLKSFRTGWTEFAATVTAVLFPSPGTATAPPGGAPR